MKKPAPPFVLRSWALSVLLVLPAAPHAQAAGADERLHIAAMIRQLNALEDTARRSAHVSVEPGQRYSLDYERLANDIERIRSGLEAYLTPRRAQPRDPSELSGHYTQSGAQTP